MKKILHIWLVCLTMLSVSSCMEETPFLSLEDDGDRGELNELLRYFEREYNMEIKADFAPTDFAPVSVGYVLDYTPVTDFEGAVRLLEYLEDSILSLLPKEFVRVVIPRRLLIVDELNHLFEYDDRMSLPNVIWTEPRPVAGYVTDKYLVFANAGARFDPDAEGLKEELLSLLIERIVSGSITNLHPIAGFSKISIDATYASGFDPNTSLISTNTPYIDGLANGKTWELITGGPSGTPWLGRGVLKSGRLGYMGFSDETVLGIRITAYIYDKATIAKDFADFTVFVMTKTAEEREAFYAAVAEDDGLNYASPSHVEAGRAWVVERDGQYYDTRFPLYGGLLGANAIREKVEFVKAWWVKVGFPLQEPE